MLLQMILFHNFLWLNDIPLCVCVYMCVCVCVCVCVYTHHVFICSSVDGHLGDLEYMYIFELWFSSGICQGMGL